MQLGNLALRESPPAEGIVAMYTSQAGHQERNGNNTTSICKLSVSFIPQLSGGAGLSAERMKQAKLCLILFCSPLPSKGEKGQRQPVPQSGTVQDETSSRIPPGNLDG